MRKKLNDDPTKLADYEIIEMLLAQVVTRKDTKPLAKELLTRFHSVKGVLEARLSELRQVNGFGPALEAHWILLRELMSRREESRARQREVLTSSALVAQMARTRLAGSEKEELWIAFVDSRNRLISWEKASQGTVAGIICYPRELLERAIILKASGMIMAHNHPGGSLNPSLEDLDLTKHIAESAKQIGLMLIDHIIITDEGHYSLSDDNLF